MKRNSIFLAIFMACNFGIISPSVAGDGDEINYSEQIEQELFSTYDGIYPEESRIIVNDTSFKYNRGTLFLNNSGHRLSNPIDDLKIGTPVQIHFTDNSHGLTLIDLKVISKREFKQSRRMLRDDN